MHGSYKQIDKYISNTMLETESLALRYDCAFFKLRGNAMLFAISCQFYELLSERATDNVDLDFSKSTIKTFTNFSEVQRKNIAILYEGGKLFAKKVGLPMKTLFAWSEVIQKDMHSDASLAYGSLSDEEQEEASRVGEKLHERWLSCSTLTGFGRG